MSTESGHISFVVFNAIKEAVTHTTSGLNNEFLSIDKRIELIESWLKDSWTWLYSKPELAYDESIGRLPDFKAFAKEIDTNRELMSDFAQQDYFRRLKNFNNGDLNDLYKLTATLATEVDTRIDHFRAEEPDQYASGRPIRQKPSSLGPDAYIEIFSKYEIEVDHWRRTVKGRAAEKEYQAWEDRLRPLSDYYNLLRRLQNDVKVISDVILGADLGTLSQELIKLEITINSQAETREDIQAENSAHTPEVWSVAAMCYYLKEIGFFKVGSVKGRIENEICPLFGFTKDSIYNKMLRYKEADLRRKKVSSIKSAIALMKGNEDFNLGSAILLAEAHIAAIETHETLISYKPQPGL